MASVQENSSTHNFPSDNKTLTFVERMTLASTERVQLQTVYEDRKKQEAEDILNTVKHFVETITDTTELTNKFIESVHNNHSKRKVVELYSFNTYPEMGDIYNRTIESVGIEGKLYPVRYILSEGYYKLVHKYFPDRYVSIRDQIAARINTAEFNNGKDVETEEKLIPCVFINKRKGSKFKNGIYISRDGIDYNKAYVDFDPRDKNKTRQNRPNHA